MHHHEAQKQKTDGGATIALALIGALLSLGYAAWAFTARRAIFADFAEGRSVSSQSAKASDTIDTVWLVAAAVVVAIGLVLLVMKMVVDEESRQGLALVGLMAALTGATAVTVGLLLVGSLGEGGSQAQRGQEAMQATVVVGGGFGLVALGLLLGALAVRRNVHTEQPSPPAHR
ncbi:MAG: hypothetical protein ACR2GB_08030 [Nocardioidaceae bacterium]